MCIFMCGVNKLFSQDTANTIRMKVSCLIIFTGLATDQSLDPLMSECLIYQIKPGRTMVRLSATSVSVTAA